MPTRREIIARIETPLTALYGEREARQIARIVVMELGGLCLTDLVAEPDKSSESTNSTGSSANWPPAVPCNTYWDIPNFTGSISRCGKGC